jgi:transcription elongation factor Elf1
MSGPGEYKPDPTEGIVKPDDLPKPKTQTRSRIPKKCRCPHCKRPATRHDIRKRKLHHLGDPTSGRPVDILLQYSVHYCCKCDKYFKVDTTDIVAPHSDYTNEVVALAVRVVVEDGLPYRSASWHLWRDHRVFVPFATIQNWVEAAGEKNILAH